MAEKLYSWEPNFNFEIFQKNIIEDDIISDNEITNLQSKIEKYCPTNYGSYNAVARSGYSIQPEYVEENGESNCNGCDTTVHCYPAAIKTEDGKEHGCGTAFSTANTCSGANWSTQK